MEQAGYWMWAKRRHGLSSHHLQASTNAAYDDSWEEQAFAEDAAGALGGCIWPPRSYSCSFCGREFRSAQALGGHMNVHRRDRARLKQSPTDNPNDETLHHQNSQSHIQNSILPMGFQYQTGEVCNFVYNPNPNSDHATTLPSPSSPSTKENFPGKTLIPTFSSPIVQEHPKTKFPDSSSPKSWSNRYYHFSDLSTTEGDKSPTIPESGCKVKADMSVSLNLVVRREETVGCKRKRSDTPTLIPFFLKPISIEKHHLQPVDIPELSSSSVDDIDLELRLGERPKVN